MTKSRKTRKGVMSACIPTPIKKNGSINIKLHINNNAKKIMQSLINKNNITNDYISQWFNEDNVKVLTFSEGQNEEIKAFAMLHKCCDEFNEHTNPHVLDYIHTLEEYRRSGLAYKLLLHLKDIKCEVSFASACNSNSANLFEKANYNIRESRFGKIYRYP